MCVQHGRRSSVRSGAFNVSDMLASCSLDGTVRLWDLRSQRAHTTLRCGAGEALYAVDFDKNIIAAGGRSKALHVWDVASDEAVLVLQSHHQDTIQGVALGGGRLCTSARDKTVRVLSNALVKVRASSAGSKVSFFRLAERFGSSSTHQQLVVSPAPVSPTSPISSEK